MLVSASGGARWACGAHDKCLLVHLEERYRASTISCASTAIVVDAREHAGLIFFILVPGV